jgi:hypothetical protein
VSFESFVKEEYKKNLDMAYTIVYEDAKENNRALDEKGDFTRLVAAVFGQISSPKYYLQERFERRDKGVGDGNKLIKAEFENQDAKDKRIVVTRLQRIQESLAAYDELSFVAEREVLIIKKPYSENKQRWIDINKIVDGWDGKWIKDGRNSRWEIKL